MKQNPIYWGLVDDGFPVSTKAVKWLSRLIELSDANQEDWHSVCL